MTSSGYVSAFTCFTLGVDAPIVHQAVVSIGKTPSPNLALPDLSVQRWSSSKQHNLAFPRATCERTEFATVHWPISAT